MVNCPQEPRKPDTAAISLHLPRPAPVKFPEHVDTPWNMHPHRWADMGDSIVQLHTHHLGLLGVQLEFLRNGVDEKANVIQLTSRIHTHIQGHAISS